MTRLLIGLFVVGLCNACGKLDTSIKDETINLPFQGTWTREFEAGPGNLHKVKYLVYGDSIHYSISGPIGNASYTMIQDTFMHAENRFIGHSENQHYVLFAKGITDQSITIYKQPIKTIDQGMKLKVPSATTTLHHGWNTFHKQ